MPHDQIESGLHRRQGTALTNFTETLLPPQSDLAQQLLKDPYNFDFLTMFQQLGVAPSAATPGVESAK